ncbi:MAG TPA: GNAT family N-acetyltransferase, partial [Bacillota bacterium]
MTAAVWTDPRFPGVSCRRVGPEALEMLLSLRSRLDHDYLADVLPDWLEDRPGGVYAYYYEDRLCGLCSIHVPRPGEAWLRGKRIALGFEGKGIGTATAVFELEEARRLGARVARLITEVGNAAVHRMMREKLGFEDLGRWWVAESLAPGDLAPAAGAQAGAPEARMPATVLQPADFAPGTLPSTLAVLEPLLSRHAAAAGGAGERPGRGRWGLWATLADPYTLAGFGPEELAEAARTGSVL